MLDCEQKHYIRELKNYVREQRFIENKTWVEIICQLSGCIQDVFKEIELEEY